MHSLTSTGPTRAPRSFSNLLTPIPFNELGMKRAADAALATMPAGPLRDSLDSLMRRARRRFFG